MHTVCQTGKRYRLYNGNGKETRRYAVIYRHGAIDFNHYLHRRDCLRAQLYGSLTKTPSILSLATAHNQPSLPDQANNSLATTGELINAIPSFR
jgi:hypothetical protein